jgi:hypothetical protein
MTLKLVNITDGTDCFKQGIEKILGREVDLRKRHYFSLLSFLFKRLSATNFNRMLRFEMNCEREHVEEIRNWMNSDGYLLQHLKPYLFRCFKLGINNREDCIEQAKSFKVKKKDYRIVRMVFLDKMKELLNPLLRYKALSFEAYQEAMTEIPTLLTKYARKFCNKKMRFIFQNQHYGLDLDDIESHVKMRGMQNVGGTNESYPWVEAIVRLMRPSIALGVIGTWAVCKFANYNCGPEVDNFAAAIGFYLFGDRSLFYSTKHK